MNLSSDDKKLVEFRKKVKLINKDIPVLKDGSKGSIELDPRNTSHVAWHKGL